MNRRDEHKLRNLLDKTNKKYGLDDAKFYESNSILSNGHKEFDSPMGGYTGGFSGNARREFNAHKERYEKQGKIAPQFHYSLSPKRTMNPLEDTQNAKFAQDGTRIIYFAKDPDEMMAVADVLAGVDKTAAVRFAPYADGAAFALHVNSMIYDEHNQASLPCEIMILLRAVGIAKLGTCDPLYTMGGKLKGLSTKDVSKSDRKLMQQQAHSARKDETKVWHELSELTGMGALSKKFQKDVQKLHHGISFNQGPIVHFDSLTRQNINDGTNNPDMKKFKGIYDNIHDEGILDHLQRRLVRLIAEKVGVDKVYGHDEADWAPNHRGLMVPKDHIKTLDLASGIG